MSAFTYIYIYTKQYPVPIFHRVSLDAKMRFIRDLDDREQFDTAIIGSSIGLNNLQGIVLEDSSKSIKRVINLSSLGLKMTQIEQLLELLALFPHIKRVIQSAELEDFSQTYVFEKSDIQFAKRYTQLGKEHIDLQSMIYTFKHLVEFAKNHWKWKKEYAPHNTNYCLSFDRTGSVPLHIYGEDINQRRWSTPPPLDQGEANYEALERVAQTFKDKGIRYYFIVEPYRQPLLDEHPDLKAVRNHFSERVQKIVEKHGGFFLDLHKKMKLGDDYFVDREHLNNKGSLLTAKEVAAFIDAHEEKNIDSRLSH
jgi:hypothetical protein